MKIKKLIITLICIIFITTILTGCGGEETAEVADKNPEESEIQDNDQDNDQEEAESEEIEDESQDEPEEMREEFYIGEHVKIGNTVLTLNGIRDSSGEEYFEPEEGHVYKIIDITIYNISEDFHSVSSLFGFELQDNEKYTYTPAFGADTKGSLDGKIPPGMKMRGEVAFEIPETAEATNLFFDYDWLGSGQINFVLNDEPVESEKFENPQEPLKMKQLGDVIEFNNAAMTVNSIRYDEGGEYFGPEDGYIYAIIDVLVENTSEENISTSSLLSYSMVDEEGYHYSTDFMAETKGSIDGEIVAGQSKRGEVAFEVPVNSENLYLIIDHDVFDKGGEVVKIK